MSPRIFSPGETVTKFLRYFLVVFSLLLVGATFVPENQRKLKWEFFGTQFPLAKAGMPFGSDLLLYLPLHKRSQEILHNRTLKKAQTGCQEFEILGNYIGLGLSPDCETQYQLPFEEVRKTISPAGETLAFGFFLNPDGDQSLSPPSSYQQLVMVGDADNGDRAQNVQHGVYLNTTENYLHYGSFLAGGHFKEKQIERGKYYFVVVTINRLTKTFRFFINGELMTEEQYKEEQFKPAYSLFIGNFFKGTNNINGLINEVALWKRALEPWEAIKLTDQLTGRNKKHPTLFVWWIRVTCLLVSYFLLWRKAWPLTQVCCKAVSRQVGLFCTAVANFFSSGYEQLIFCFIEEIFLFNETKEVQEYWAKKGTGAGKKATPELKEGFAEFFRSMP